MPESNDAPPYHRKLTPSNMDEVDKVERTMEIWGREARVLAGGLCVKAYPGFHSGPHADSFGCRIPPRLLYGFRGRRQIVREVAWDEGMPGVETRELGRYACVPISWVRR